VRNGQLNLNQVDFADLRSLDLSVTQCHRLLAYRERIGGYESIEQLDDVPGFPSDVRERVKRQLTV
jgi:DNA uptake protein ComE-like DNA-binding protein